MPSPIDSIPFCRMIIQPDLIPTEVRLFGATACARMRSYAVVCGGMRSHATGCEIEPEPEPEPEIEPELHPDPELHPELHPKRHPAWRPDGWGMGRKDAAHGKALRGRSGEGRTAEAVRNFSWREDRHGKRPPDHPVALGRQAGQAWGAGESSGASSGLLTGLRRSQPVPWTVRPSGSTARHSSAM